MPVWIWGRDAKATQCKGEHAVWRIWNDVICPYFECCRVPTDTLFIVAEADWIMSQEHSAACELYMQETNDLWVECQDPLPKPPTRSAQPATDAEGAEDEPEAKGPTGRGSKGRAKRHRSLQTDPADASGKGPRPFHEWYQPTRVRRPAPTAGAPAASPPMLQDLVQACNVAAHLGAGDLVWLSYAGWARGRQTMPGNGSTAIGLTRLGADLIAQCLTQAPKPRHFDLQLLDWLMTSPVAQPEASQLLQERSCYVWNGFGGYRTHLSGCDKKAGVRAAKWVAPLQEWTRPCTVPGNKLAACERRLVRFGATGDAFSNKLTVLEPKSVLNDRDSIWTTYFPSRLMKNDRPDYDLIEREVAMNISRRRGASSASSSAPAAAAAELEEAPNRS